MAMIMIIYQRTVYIYGFELKPQLNRVYTQAFANRNKAKVLNASICAVLKQNKFIRSFEMTKKDFKLAKKMIKKDSAKNSNQQKGKC